MIPDRRFEVQPAHQRHGTRFRWSLIGPELAVQFLLRIGSQGELAAWDLGFHCSFDPGWATPMEECDLLERPCWYDGSSLNAEPIFDVLCDKGEDGLWDELDRYYEEQWQYICDRMASV